MKATGSKDPDMKYQAAIIKRLNVLIALQLTRDKATSTTEKIRALRDAGMTPSEIAGVVGKGINYVSAVLGRKGAK
jgi:hypothetical protein